MLNSETWRSVNLCTKEKKEEKKLQRGKRGQAANLANVYIKAVFLL